MPNENEITDALRKMETRRGSHTGGAKKITKYSNRAEILKKEKKICQMNLVTVNLS